jgi:hypothetical protein
MDMRIPSFTATNFITAAQAANRTSRREAQVVE